MSNSAISHKNSKIILIIWLAFLASAFFYISIAYSTLVAESAQILVSDAGPSIGQPSAFSGIFSFNHPLEIPLTLAALLMFGASLAVPGFLGKGTANPQSDLIQKIVRLALIETGILIGFGLALIKREFGAGLPFFILGLIMFALAYPGTNWQTKTPGENRGTLS